METQHAIRVDATPSLVSGVRAGVGVAYKMPLIERCRIPRMYTSDIADAMEEKSKLFPEAITFPLAETGDETAKEVVSDTRAWLCLRPTLPRAGRELRAYKGRAATIGFWKRHSESVTARIWEISFESSMEEM